MRACALQPSLRKGRYVFVHSPQALNHAHTEVSIHAGRRPTEKLCMTIQLSRMVVCAQMGQVMVGRPRANASTCNSLPPVVTLVDASGASLLVGGPMMGDMFSHSWRRPWHFTCRSV